MQKSHLVINKVIFFFTLIALISFNREKKKQCFDVSLPVNTIGEFNFTFRTKTFFF